MLEIAFIRKNREVLQQTADQKGIPLSIADLLAQDEQRRRLLVEVERLRYERNRLSEIIGELMKQGKPIEAEEAKKQVKEINGSLGSLEISLTTVDNTYREWMLLVPNIVSLDTPNGASDEDNVEIRRVGEVPRFDFSPMNHVELGERLGILDIPRGVKIAGSRHYVLKGLGYRLHRAVQQLAMDVLEHKGFTPLEVPTIVRGETLLNTGFFPTGEDQIFALAEEDKYLVGTSEASLVSYFGNEVVEMNGPIRLAAATSCFRKEIGSSGRDVQGLYRVHQFAKVEQVVLCENDPVLSEQLLQEMTQHAEEILRMLELPYRVVAVCIGDMSQKTHKQFDIETWMPSRQSYGETHSASNLLDFQARRANIRYRDSNGKLRYCHTLNNTAVASPRILIPLLENHQKEDGSVYVPKALRPYLNGIEEILPI
ncbi:serine--tRNA ligase [Cohnella boryungensis]|uniref:Serine--tRNA ligase n=1 Tax=Cohnella boryungensis TaxID=768479 RepID=A0ABV8SH03_9BACL